MEKKYRRKKSRSNKKVTQEKIEDGEFEDNREYVRGVFFFIPHTENSELAKRIREKLKSFEEVSCIRVKIVEKVGEKLVDMQTWKK